jgi:hypothetical protein
MSLDHGVEVWSSDGWRRRATAWVDERLAAAGVVRTGEPEQRSLRPWAVVLRVPTAGAPVWFKAPGPLVAFEVGLYELLARVAPERVLTPLAVDVERGWLLLPDGGPSIGERAAGPALVGAMAAALPRYAQLQRALAPHAGELLDLGVSDMRPELMPARFEEALDAVRGYVDRRGARGAEREAVERIAAMRPTVAEWCERLAAGPVPASLDHNDLHAWNVLGGAGEEVRFYDWGDAVVAHPFASMLALGWMEMEPADLLRLRDAYLEPFSDLAPHAALVEELELACRVGKIARALTWHRATSPYAPDEVEERWLGAPLESLASLLEDSWLGRA